MPSSLATRTVSGLVAIAIRSNRSHDAIPTLVNSARWPVATTADTSKIALTTEIPAMSAVLFQLVCSMLGPNPYYEANLRVISARWFGAKDCWALSQYRGKGPNWQRKFSTG